MSEFFQRGNLRYYHMGRGWFHVVDMEMPDVIRDKCDVSELLTASNADAMYKGFLSLTGVGKKTADAWMDDAGFVRRWCRKDEA